MIEVLKQALEVFEKHYPYEDESGIIKLSLGRYMNGLQYLRQAIAELESQEPVAWDLADKVRQDLDRQSCPDAFMRIAVESIVKHHSPQPAQRTEQEPTSFDLSHIDRLTHFKTTAIIEAQGYKITGFVHTNDDGKKCISDMAAVCWFEGGDFFAMMHSTLPAQPTQRTEPLIGCVNHDCAKCKELESQEPVGFAGIEMWIGNTRIKKLMTQTELHSAIDPWAIVEFNSDSCIDALKEKNT